MKKIILGLIFFGSASLSHAYSNVNLSINSGYPSYGIVNVNNAPPPVIYREPVVVHRTRTVYQPTYMYVPEVQYRNWGNYCGRYGACGRPVYFIQNSYYERGHRGHRGRGHGWGHEKRHHSHYEYDRGYHHGHRNW